MEVIPTRSPVDAIRKMFTGTENAHRVMVLGCHILPFPPPPPPPKGQGGSDLEECPYCGRKRRIDDKGCPGCGAPLQRK